MNASLINNCTLLVGKRKSGKSWLLKHLLQAEKHKFSKIFCCCPTESLNSFYADIIPKENIFAEYNEKWADHLIKKMMIVNEGKREGQNGFINVLLILDDCIAFSDFHQSETLKKIYSTGRHFGLGIVCTTQYLKSVSPLIRTNSDYIYVGQMNSQSLDILSDEYLSAGLSKQEFITMYNRCTKDYNFLVINNNSVLNDDKNLIYGVIKTPI